MSVSRRLMSAFVLLIVFILSNCTPSPLFPDRWDSEVARAFERSESPYPDSPDAVILFDLEKLEINKVEWAIIRKRHTRIQIFTEEGKKHADVRIPFWHTEKVSDIKAQTILPDGRRIPLEAKDIFEEGEEERWRYKVFALPGVESNCIIEYQYKYREEGLGLIHPKYFQSYLFTEYTNLELTLPQGFTYTGMTRNEPPGFVEPEGVELHEPGGIRKMRFTWEVHDLKPILDEAYTYNRKDHLFQLQFQMVSYVDAYNNITFIKEWKDMVARLQELYFSYDRHPRALKDLLAQIDETKAGEAVTAKEIYRYIRDQYENERFTGLTADDMTDVISDQSGSRVEKNLLLVALFKEAGFQAESIVISRRSNGRINKAAPSLNDFNHILARVEVGGDWYLLDASAKYHSWRHMPSDNHSGIGLVIADGEPRFLEFPSSPPLSQRNILTTCTLNAEGDLVGSFEIEASGYLASNLRSDYADAKDDLDFLYEEVLDHFDGIMIDSLDLNIDSKDHTESVIMKIYFTLSGHVSPSGDMTFLPSTMMSRFDRNRLTNEDRTFPVQFSYPQRIRETINIMLPPGFEVTETPKNVSVRGPGLGFQKLYEVNGQNIQILWSHQLSKLVHRPTDYKTVRNFYTEAVNVDKQMIVLKETGK